jgi:hypothetical protein
VKHIGFVSFYWTLAFILKFITAFIDKLQPGIPIDPDTEQAYSLFISIVYFALSLVTDIVPFMIVADTQFIKIFSYELIKKFNTDMTKDNDLENALIMAGQEENLANLNFESG